MLSCGSFTAVRRKNEQYINRFLGLRNNENLLSGSNNYKFVFPV